LPWRGERDPYRLLVSEVMLQQTQAARVAPIYERFLGCFPTVESLADAEAADVLRSWENLGYNRRALNLWRTARAIVERGGFPRTVDGLLGLPGIGPYTARAVASFAFGADVAAVDANVRRVVMRSLGAELAGVQSTADALVPRGRAARWNQAMIDLGAEVCRARSPRCDVCPLRTMCSWTGADNPSARSGDSAPFVSTNRYARGRVVDALRRRESLTIAQLVRDCGLAEPRVRTALGGLEKDGLIRRRNRGYALGPSVPERAASSRR
jgi:A/G-specific adenine glycosylase